MRLTIFLILPRSAPRIWNASRVGGCTFPSDPRHNYARAAPIWSAAVDPLVIRAHASSCESGALLAFDVAVYEHRVVLSPTAQHILVLSNDIRLRLDVVGGSVLSGPVNLEIIVPLEHVHKQIAEIFKLRTMLRHATPRPDKDPRLSRLVLALRAMDARAEGASLRDIASGIFGANDWPGEGDCIKSRARRLVRLASTLKRAGPGGVLAGKV